MVFADSSISSVVFLFMVFTKLSTTLHVLLILRYTTVLIYLKFQQVSGVV